MWIRVFGLNEVVPSVAKLCDHLESHNFRLVPEVKGDDLGWTECRLALAGVPIGLARYLTVEDDLRDDLNAYAAELEGNLDIQPQAGPLMERVIQTKQLITIRQPLGHPNEAAMESCCELIAKWLAIATDGVYQMDGKGWFTSEGVTIVTEY